MNEIEKLRRAYERELTRPWSQNLAGVQKVWFARYNPQQERRLRAAIGEFAIATHDSGHGWIPCDLTTSFAQWLDTKDYRESYFENPTDIELPLDAFPEFVAELIATAAKGAGENDVVAVWGVASLFGLTRLSAVVGEFAPSIKGRLLVFFPGQRDNSNYRLLGARDGWNYHAVPIEAD